MDSASQGGRRNCHSAPGAGSQREALWRAEKEAGPLHIRGAEAEPV
uniref:Tumor protein D52-like 2 n=1 Tax=Mus musculus TaxID=10090 RepID=V9GXN2_MOUSE